MSNAQISLGLAQSESLALLVGLRLVRSSTDPDMAAVARQIEARLIGCLDAGTRQALADLPYRIPVLEGVTPAQALRSQIRSAAVEWRKLDLNYCDALGARTLRRVWPLGLIGWSGIWVLLAWCELRLAYRSFRVERIGELATLDDRFELSETCCIAHYFKMELGSVDGLGFGN